MTLEPPKHGHGGEPDKKRLHKIFLYFKFTRLLIGGIASFSMTNMALDAIDAFNGDMQTPNVIFNTIPVDNHMIAYGYIFMIIVMLAITSIILTNFSKKYRIIKHAHMAYCDCDRKRWYNRE